MLSFCVEYSEFSIKILTLILFKGIMEDTRFKKEGKLLLIKSAESEEMTIFDKENQPNAQVQMGIITLQPGEKRPLAGYARHEQDEYSYVISGEAHTILEDGQDLVGKAGQAQLIEAGEGHINYNDGVEPAVVVWMLVERTE